MECEHYVVEQADGLDRLVTVKEQFGHAPGEDLKHPEHVDYEQTEGLGPLQDRGAVTVLEFLENHEELRGHLV